MSTTWHNLDLAQVPSPCFVVDEALLRRNLELLADVQRHADCRILLALKGFAMFATFPLCRRHLAGCCASGAIEARLAREEFGGEVETFAPAFSDEDFEEVLALSDKVVFNSFSQWKHFREKALAANANGREGVPPGMQDGSVGVPPASFDGRPARRAAFLDYAHPLKAERHKLPHFQQEDVVCMATYRLADALPKEKLQELEQVRDGWLSQHPQSWTEAAAQEYHAKFEDEVDRWLDAGEGSRLLARPDVRTVVEQAFRHFDGVRYEIISYAIMPNHVHVLFRPLAGNAIGDIMHSWKSFTAKEINKVLGRDGSVWQCEYWDRLVRNGKHLEACLGYIRRNPKKAGLAEGTFALWEREDAGGGTPPESGQDAHAPVPAVAHVPVPAAARRVSFGLRVNPEFSEVGVALYNPCAPNSRLGVTRANFEPAELDGIEGLHFHCLCEQNADALEHTLAAFEEKFGEFLPRMKWVNFGGGHHVTREDYDVERLVRIIRGFRGRWPNIEAVYLEPGEAVGLNTGVLAATVLDVIRNGMEIAILDTSAECHMPDVLAMPYRPAIIGAGKPGEKPHTYRLGGPTCLAGDIIGDYSFDRPLKRGDRLLFLDMAHYSMVKTTTFNGMRLPAIALWDSARPADSFRVLHRYGYADYKSRLS